jgi:hypothetical protein
MALSVCQISWKMRHIDFCGNCERLYALVNIYRFLLCGLDLSLASVALRSGTMMYNALYTKTDAGNNLLSNNNVED